MKRLAIFIWGALSIGMAALALPLAEKAYARDTDGYGLALALLLWTISITNAAVGGSCIGAAVWPKKS